VVDDETHFWTAPHKLRYFSELGMKEAEVESKVKFWEQFDSGDEFFGQRPTGLLLVALYKAPDSPRQRQFFILDQIWFCGGAELQRY